MCISLNICTISFFVVAKSVVVTVAVLPTQVVIGLLAACTQFPVRGLLAFTSITQQTNNPNMDTFAKIFMCPKMTLWVPKQKIWVKNAPKMMELPFVLSIFHFLNIGHFSFARSRFSISTQAPPNKNPSAVHDSENDFLGSSYIPSPHLGIAEINYKFGSLQNTHDTSRSPEVLVAIACLEETMQFALLSGSLRHISCIVWCSRKKHN